MLLPTATDNCLIDSIATWSVRDRKTIDVDVSSLSGRNMHCDAVALCPACPVPGEAATPSYDTATINYLKHVP